MAPMLARSFHAFDEPPYGRSCQLLVAFEKFLIADPFLLGDRVRFNARREYEETLSIHLEAPTLSD